MKCPESSPHLTRYWFYRRRANFLRDRSAFESWVMLVAEEGRFAFEVEDERGVAGFGDLVVCRPHVEFWRHVQSTLTYHVIQFCWRNRQGEIVQPEVATGHWPVQDVNRLSMNLAELRALWQQQDAWSEHYKDHLLQDIWHLAFKAQHTTRRRNDTVMHSVAQQLQGRAGEAFPMKEISDEVQLTPVQFTRRFQSALGQTPSDYLTSLRLHKARTLLLETDWTLQRIAQECGYSSGLYLNRVFRLKMRTTPGQFRKTHRV
jgi:AraC-like DNA-binding protein